MRRDGGEDICWFAEMIQSTCNTANRPAGGAPGHCWSLDKDKAHKDLGFI